MKPTFLLSIAVLSASSAAMATELSNFKSPAAGMHFTKGQPLVVYADLEDDRDIKGMIVCPSGQTVSNYSQAPSCTTAAGTQAQCSGGGTPVGWPQLRFLIDGAIQIDSATNSSTVPGTTLFDCNTNPSPIGYYPFHADTSSLSTGVHQLVIRGLYSADGVSIDTVDSAPIAITIDDPPAKTVVTLTADLNGPVNWNNVMVVGNGHAVTASGALSIKSSLVTGLSGLSGSVDSADIEGSIFEDTGVLNLTLGSGAVTVNDNEFRANNRLTFVSWDPSVPYILQFMGGTASQKLFQGNNIGAGKVLFEGDGWLIGGDTDAQTNIFIGPRCMMEIFGDNITVRGNYDHHNYRGQWSQGLDFEYYLAGSNVLTEHNFIRDTSWPVDTLSGEFRYNVVFGYGHEWIRSPKNNTVMHHNLFTPGGDGESAAGILCYNGSYEASGLVIYNNTFDGGGAAMGDFAVPFVDMDTDCHVTSLRNNLFTFARDQLNDNPGLPGIIGGAPAYASADYNAFYSPDNSNKTNYDYAGAGSHDVSGGGAVGVVNGQLGGDPYAGARITVDQNRIIESVVDEALIWERQQPLSQVLALFRTRYTPKSNSPVVDAGDPADVDSQNRKADIGAIDLDGHDLDKLGKFGSCADYTPPTATLTKPTGGQLLKGTVRLTATASDDQGGTGVKLVVFLVDGSTIAQTSTSPFSVSFDTSMVLNGTHTFSAKALDGCGNVGVSAGVMADTKNPPKPVGSGGGSPAGSGGGSPSGAGGGSTHGHGGGSNAGGGADDATGGNSSGCACSTHGDSTLSTLWLALGLAAFAGIGLRRAARQR